MHEIKLPLKEFSREQLDPAIQESNGVEFRKAVQEYFEAKLLRASGAAEVIVTEKDIILKWINKDSAQGLTELGVNYLTNGDYSHGIHTLQFALQKDPEDGISLYNLGMALSDKGRLEESATHLQKLASLEPTNARAWVALGVTQARQHDVDNAIHSLQTAINIEPSDPYALKNLGALLLENSSDMEVAESHLKKAALILKDDPQVWINLAKLYEKTDRWDDADHAYLKALEANPYGSLAELAEKGRSNIAERNFRAKGDTRPDALMYCIGAIQKLEGLPIENVREITFEIATLGMNGLDVNDPAQKYSINSLQGQYSGLNLLCIEYVGFKQIDPSVDIGFDLTKEYEAAMKMTN